MLGNATGRDDRPTDLAQSVGADESAEQIAGLLEALTTRNVIGQAQGILIERHGTDAEGAFEILVRISQRSHLKLRDVARRVVDQTISNRQISE